MRLRGICQQIQFSEQVRVLFRGHEAEVAALELCVLQVRQEPEDRESGLLFEHRFERAVQHLGAVRKDEGAEVAVGLPGSGALRHRPQTVHQSAQGQARALRADHQDDGQVQHVSDMPGAGLRRDTADTVVEAHDAFRHDDVCPGGVPVEQGLQPVFLREVQVEVVARDAEGRPVEHGVDVVRSALEGVDPRAPSLQRRQHRAGDRGLPAAGCRRREQQFIHGSSP